MPQIKPPEFELGSRPRVLVEASEWVNREVLVKHLHEAGYAVVGCAGPDRADEDCTLVATGSCAGADEADVILQSLRHTDPRNHEVLRSIRRTYPDTPIVVEVPSQRVAAFPDDFAGLHVVPHPATLEQLRKAVEKALEGKQAG